MSTTLDRTSVDNFKHHRTIALVSDDPSPAETYAASQLAMHVHGLLGSKPKIVKHSDARQKLVDTSNVIILGQVDSNPGLKQLAAEGILDPNTEEQGYSLRIDVNSDKNGNPWRAVLCGADPQGTLNCVRDFSHYYFFREGKGITLRQIRAKVAPRIKVRMVHVSGTNLFAKYGYYAHPKKRTKVNTYFLDWLSEWKATHVSVWWCNHLPVYDKLWKELILQAHARHIKVVRGAVPYRPRHEGPPADLGISRFNDSSVQSADMPARESTRPASCPRDANTKKWYTDRLIQLATQKPLIDGMVVESPLLDYVQCKCSKCINKPMTDSQIIDPLLRKLRRARPDMDIGRLTWQAVANQADIKALTSEVTNLGDTVDWQINHIPDRADRIRWHDIGPKCGTLMRPFREVLKGEQVDEEIDALFDDFLPSAERDIALYIFVYRYYAGQMGSFWVKDDKKVMKMYPAAKGPFSLALLCEAAFDPFIEGAARRRKLNRMRDVTIPDYPRTGVVVQ